MDTWDKFLSARDQHINLKKETPTARNSRLQLSSVVPTTVREEVSSQAGLRQADYDIIPEMIFKKVVSKGKSFRDAGVVVRIGLYDSASVVSKFHGSKFHLSRPGSGPPGLGPLLDSWQWHRMHQFLYY